MKNITATLLFLRSYKEVITICDQILKIKPDAHEILSNKGLSLSLLGRNDEALTNLNEAVKLQPEDPFFGLTRPLSWLVQGVTKIP
ncbi:tetratricopeptide repeat protein [Nostoc sp.]|uniref:tetratricopeptide repeat protein n=1 Tax=Nostoc sp. TaxID=1180 RepID=UPI002FF8D5FE